MAAQWKFWCQFNWFDAVLQMYSFLGFKVAWRMFCARCKTTRQALFFSHTRKHQTNAGVYQALSRIFSSQACFSTLSVWPRCAMNFTQTFTMPSLKNQTAQHLNNHYKEQCICCYTILFNFLEEHLHSTNNLLSDEMHSMQMVQWICLSFLTGLQKIPMNFISNLCIVERSMWGCLIF